ncbi:MAG: hypothetical protein C0399_05935 [Syntrophus sp. (in: bacteria)]|nr:hypothetical protein [Syntrophus sp. (in: bacteria)]
MKKSMVVLVVIAVGFISFSCVSEGYNTQKGAAIGAGLGAIAGQVIGRDTASTLIGAAVGGLAGAVGGNAVDQNVTNQKIEAAQRSRPAVAAAPEATQQSTLEGPPGQWIEVPGQWAGGKWIPAHKVWVPVNP